MTGPRCGSREPQSRPPATQRPSARCRQQRARERLTPCGCCADWRIGSLARLLPDPFCTRASCHLSSGRTRSFPKPAMTADYAPRSYPFRPRLRENFFDNPGLKVGGESVALPAGLVREPPVVEPQLVKDGRVEVG